MEDCGDFVFAVADLDAVADVEVEDVCGFFVEKDDVLFAASDFDAVWDEFEHVCFG